jgi:hypothetical protein
MTCFLVGRTRQRTVEIASSTLLSFLPHAFLGLDIRYDLSGVLMYCTPLLDPSSHWFPFLLFQHIYREDHQRGKQSGPPETKIVEEGSAKRNITRKHDHDPNRKEKKQHGGAGGKGKWDETEDGTQ